MVVDVVVALCADPERHPVERQIVAGPPGDVVIGAGCVAADADCTEQQLLRVVECQPAAENVHAADAPAAHRVIALTEVRRRSAIGGFGIHGIAVLQAVQAAARLNRRVQIGGGKRESRQAEGVGGVGLLCRDHAATGPLRAAIRTGEGNRTDDAVPVDHGAPHVEVKATVRLRPGVFQCDLELAVRG